MMHRSVLLFPSFLQFNSIFFLFTLLNIFKKLDCPQNFHCTIQTHFFFFCHTSASHGFPDTVSQQSMPRILLCACFLLWSVFLMNFSSDIFLHLLATTIFLQDALSTQLLTPPLLPVYFWVRKCLIYWYRFPGPISSFFLFSVFPSYFCKDTATDWIVPCKITCSSPHSTMTLGGYRS